MALAADVVVDDELQYRLVTTYPPTDLRTSLAAMPLATHVLNISYSMVAGGGTCCALDGLMGGGGSTDAVAVCPAADRTPLLSPGNGGAD